MTTTPNWVRGLCIGRGSFGTVSFAVDKSDGGVFAVKSVKQNSERFSQALENEIRILRSLTSPYVVGYRGDDVTSEKENSPVVYRNLHMEYMPGGTVADLAKHGEDVTVRSYTRCIVSALKYIHERNIVHCDVKGKNVLVGVIPGEAKLADFGSAVEFGGAPVSGTRGSPLWMAPEVVRGECQGPESDVWSLGCTVIEMVTGKPAWEDRGVDTLFQIGYSDELPHLPGHFSDELHDFLNKCLRRDPSERWTCDQLLRHPFLLSCSSSSSSSSEFMDRKWSPRCVFDWSDTNFSDGETSEIENTTTNLNSSNGVRRIATLASNSSANWESDGWEVVRNANAAVTTTEFSEEDENLTTIAAETAETWPEYSFSAANNEGERIREYRDSSNGSFQFHNDHQCTRNYAQGTSGGCSSRDTDNNYSCCMYVSLKKLLLFNSNAVRHIYYKQLFLFNFKLLCDLFSVCCFLINYPTTNILLNKDYRNVSC